MSASGVRAGKVFVEIGADPKAFFAALNRVNKSIGNIGRAMAGAGSRLMASGVGMAAPIAAAVSQGAKFESTLNAIRASTGLTAGEIDKVKSASMQMSAALGVGPTEAAQGMLELLKAGRSLESVLGGAGQSALEFAKVGEMDVAQAAVVMSDAMNVFRVTGGKAANTLSAAADASSTSIAQMAEAFSMSSAVAGLAKQSIDDLSATLAILANAGVKGSDAGTSVKTMLMRLMAPADDAAAAMAQVGLSVQSFRGADGKMRPMVEILGTLNAAMGNLDQAAKDDVFRRIFGADAIRAASILSSAGVSGFQGMLDSMSKAMPVGEKFKTMMGGLAGAGLRLLAGLERVAIAISDAVGPALQSIVPFIEGALNGFAKFASENKQSVALFAQVAVAAVGLGSALVGLGVSLQVASFGMGGVIKAAALVASPLYAMAAAANFAGKSFVLAMPETIKLMNAVGSAVLSASASVVGAMARIAYQTAAAAVSMGFIASASVKSAASVYAAWIAPVAPLLLLSAAALGVGIAVKQLEPQISDAFSRVSDSVSQAAGSIGEGFTVAIADAVVVFGDLFGIAQTTFGGIYDAVVSGDLSGAMDILWAGLQAGWLRGVEGLMSYVDPWIATFQNTFVALGTEIAVAWDSMTTMLASTQWGATLLGVVDNIVNGVMAAFDVMVATVRKSWNYVQSLMVKGYDLAAENRKVDSEMAARARERSVSRPGIEGRTAKAAAEGDAMRAASATRIEAMRAGAAQTMQDNLAASGPDRAAQTAAAEQRLADLTQGAAMKRADIQSLPGIQDALASVKNMTELGSIGQQISGLIDRDTLTADQESAALEAYRKAQQRLAAEVAPGGAAGDVPPPPKTESMGAIAGSFSSLNLGQAFGGTSLAERTARAAEETARNTRDMKADKVAA